MMTAFYKVINGGVAKTPSFGYKYQQHGEPKLFVEQSITINEHYGNYFCPDW